MADWEHKPSAEGYEIGYQGPSTLVEDYEDEALDIREKSSVSKRIFTGEYNVSQGVTKTMMDFFDTKKLSTAFSILTYDPQAADPDTDTASVYFVFKPEPRYVAANLLRIEVEFREA